MTLRPIATAVAAAALCLSLAGAADAQKSRDTIRYATTESVKLLDPYFFTHFEAAPIYRTMYENIVGYDARHHKIVGVLAKSWTVVEPGIYDFDLRDDVVYSNGDKFTADDVVYFINWAIDPKSRIHNKPRYMWAKGAEKLGEYKVRVRMVTPTPKDLLDIAANTWELNSKVHKALGEDNENYGRNPVGTGPYKVASLDSNKAIVMVPNERFTPSPGREAARVKRLEGIYIPDQDVQIAQIMTGGVDIIRDPNPDHLSELAKNKNLEVTGMTAHNMIYLQYDVANRAGNKALSDVRVRKALTMAINRDELIKHIAAGGSFATRLDSMCFEDMLACDLAPTPPYKYDVAQAKKLLAEAGYATGLEIELASRNPSKEAAVALAGYWNAIGVKTNVQLMTIITLDKARADGKLQAYIGERPLTTADASHVPEIFFLDARRDYWRDDTIVKLAKEGYSIFDDKKRSEHYKKMFDRINEEAFMLPIHTLPSVYIHSKDVKIFPHALVDYDTNISEFGWK
jgi:peptide/nickel transport system substrate-binding protein